MFDAFLILQFLPGAAAAKLHHHRDGSMMKK
jgi:hypothetical protein